jgi:FlaA1/EpsC-like NDP-sugar epimerase
MSEPIAEVRSNGNGAGELTLANRERPRWLRRRIWTLAFLDGAAAVVATMGSQFLAFGFGHAELLIRDTEVPYWAAILAVVPAWLGSMAMAGCYDVGPFGEPTAQTRRIVNAGTHFLALMAVAYYIAHLEQLGRDFMIAIAPLATGITLAVRVASRSELRFQRSRGRATRPALVVGPSSTSRPLLDHLAEHPEAGLTAVAALLPPGDPMRPEDVRVPVAGTTDDVMTALTSTGADVLVVTSNLRPGELRDLTWELEGKGVDVLVAPTVTQMAAFFDVRPVAGLPLLYVDQG